MIRNGLGITGVLLIGIYVVLGFIACWGKPYDLFIAKHIPWEAWICFVLGVIAYSLFYWDAVWERRKRNGQ
jgi:hypothetical protein